MLAGVVSVLFLNGCASRLAPAYMAQCYYGDVASVSKQAQGSSVVVLGWFGTETYPSAATIAKNNGISKIASVERYMRPLFLSIVVEYVTIVSGE